MTTLIRDDIVQPFQVDPFALRGRLVRLGPALDEILTRHDYPAPVATALGEAIILAVTLSRALKFQGVFTLQTKGDGPIKMMVADVTTDGAIRGYAQFDAEKVAALDPDHVSSVPRLFGSGYLALTVDQGEHTDRYQGIVALEGATLAECVHHYFRQSEQVEAGLKASVARVPGADGRMAWRGGALMIERLPAGELNAREAEDEGWRRAMILMSTSTSSELLAADLAPDTLIFRLFHEEGVRVYPPHALVARCRCSAERVERMLAALPPADITELTVDGKVVVTCEFCNAHYAYDEAQVAALARPVEPIPAP